MSTSHYLHRILLVFVLSFSASSSIASPFTFQFVTPDWTENNDPAQFGTALALSITVDNDANTNISQAYNFTDITSITATAIGGTFVQTFNATDQNSLGSWIQDGDPALITDDTGHVYLQLALLDSPATCAGYEVGVGYNAPLSLLFVNQGYCWGQNIYLFHPSDVVTDAQAWVTGSGVDIGQTLDFVLVSVFTPLTSVPEPASLALMGLGLVGLAAARRHRTFDPKC